MARAVLKKSLECGKQWKNNARKIVSSLTEHIGVGYLGIGDSYVRGVSHAYSPSFRHII